LVEIRRRVQVLLEWAWAYVTWHRGSRLIVDVATDTSAHDATLLQRAPQLAAARKLESRPTADAAHEQSVLQHGPSVRTNTGARTRSSV
jgi:hypothetical protein